MIAGGCGVLSSDCSSVLRVLCSNVRSIPFKPVIMLSRVIVYRCPEVFARVTDKKRDTVEGEDTSSW
jgi:hypothetical protein